MPKTTRVRWTRDQLLVVLNLYHKLRFGQFDQRQPVVVDLAQRLGRTPSAVAMKLSNLASLDPALKLRGVQGLEGASNLDRASHCWNLENCSIAAACAARISPLNRRVHQQRNPNGS